MPWAPLYAAPCRRSKAGRLPLPFRPAVHPLAALLFFSSFLHARPPAGTEKAFETTGSFVSEVRPRAQPEACSSPGRAYYPASLSKGTECSASCIICPASRKRGSSRCVLHLLGIEYHPASLEAGSESPFTLPGTAAGYRFDKTNKTKKGRAGFPARPCVYYNDSCFKASGISTFTSSYCNTNLQPSSAGTNIPLA